MRFILLLLSFSLVGFFLAPAPLRAAKDACAIGALGQLVGTLAQETNRIRADRGKRPLQIDARLSQAAQRHACDLARRQTVSHCDGRGRRPMSRIMTAGFWACFSAENLAQATTTPARTIRVWQSSAAHAQNQQDRRTTAMGFGVASGADGHLNWVGVYAADCRSPAVSQQSGQRLRPFRW